MSKKILVFGAGGHAKVVLNALQEQGGYVVTVSVDKINANTPKNILEFPVIPREELLLQDIESFVIAIGDNKIRRKLYEEFSVMLSPATIFHPSASIAKSARVGVGSVVLTHAVVHPDAVIGNNVIINTSAIVEHDCVLADHCQIAPMATLCGGVKIGKETLIAAGATIVPGIKIGNHSVVAAGAVVVSDVPDNTVVMGVPAKVVREIELE